MSESEMDTVKVSETAQPVKVAPKSSGKRKALVAVLVVVAVIAAVAVMVVKPGGLGSPVKQVGSIDQEAIMSLDAFKNAEKEFNTFKEAKEKEFETAIKGKAGKKDADAELSNLSRKIQLELTTKRNELLNPLQTRAEAAVASVARSKGLTVVLDKRIVIYGVEDITDAVKTTFEQEGELKLPDDVDTSSCSVAYFDQSVVRSLKVFSEAEIKLYQARNDMMREYEKKVASMSASEKEALQRAMTARLEALQEQIMTPLYQKVTTSVNQVAKNEGISLVLDKQNVMYGGRNITDSVVETFLSNVNGAPASESAPVAPVKTPAATTDKK